jgi:uncharacterized membrane protein
MTAHYDTAKHFVPPGRRWQWQMALLALAAFLGAEYVTILTLAGRGSIPPCAKLHLPDCREFSAGNWSWWLNIPVAAMGAAVYGLMMLLIRGVGAGVRPRWQGLAWRGLLFLSILTVGAAAWFLFLSVLVTNEWCLTCLAVHLPAVAVAISAVYRGPLRFKRRRRPRPDPVKIRRDAIVSQVFLGMLCVSVLIIGQVVTAWANPTVATPVVATGPLVRILPPPPRLGPPTSRPRPYRPPATRIETSTRPTPVFPATTNPAGGYRHRFLDGISLDARQFPILGPVDAPKVLVWLLDYSSPDTPRMQEHIDAIRARYGDQIAVLAVGVPKGPDRIPGQIEGPLRTPARDYAQLAAAVWLTKPQAFEAFHIYLLSDRVRPPLDRARNRAEELVGANALKAQLEDPGTEEQLQRQMDLYRDNRGKLPQVFIANLRIVGCPETPDQYYDMIEIKLGLKPVRP